MDDSESLTSLAAVGSRLMAVRNKQQLSQTQFANLLGISLRAYQTYEAGQRSIPIEALQALNRELNSDLNWILMGVSSVKAGHALNLPEPSVTENTLARLGWLYEQMTALLGLKAFSPSVLAEAIGEETAERLESILAGRSAAPFKLLDAIAEYCSADAAWLKHDQRNPFPTEQSFANYGNDFYSELSSAPFTTLHIVRANTDEGQIMIVKQINERNFKIYPTTIHMSDKIGTMGEGHQHQFRETCEKLYQGPGNILGYILGFDDFRDIAHGACHPLLSLKSKNRSHWASDWWDAEYLGRAGEMEEYWPGFNQLVRRVHEK